MIQRKLPIILWLAMLPIILSACASGGGSATTPTTSSSANNGQGHYKVGQPYEVNGTWYSPAEDYSYDETGIASWYGKDFHGNATANGETYNKNELTAAHKTLPLPTLARVTNLDNGRSLVVRINDRGPFSGARIIDVSQRAAQLLGFEQIGTAKVRVQVLADESKAIADAMRHYGTSERQVATAPEAVPAVAAPIVVAQNLPSGVTEPATPAPIPPATIADDQKLSRLPVIEAPTSIVAEPLPVNQANVEVKTLEPVRTTAAVHERLLKTQPVPEVVQLPVPTQTHLYVQAGAFTQLENATKMQESLASYGQASISDIVVNNTTFHRVRLPVDSVTSADKLLATLRKAGIANLHTVVD